MIFFTLQAQSHFKQAAIVIIVHAHLPAFRAMLFVTFQAQSHLFSFPFPFQQ